MDLCMHVTIVCGVVGRSLERERERERRVQFIAISF